MKQIADTKRRDVSFDIGDLVLLSILIASIQFLKENTRNLPVASMDPMKFWKKSDQFTNSIYQQSHVFIHYKLHLPAESRIHPIFHVSLLKRYHTNTNVNEHDTEIPSFSDDGEVLLTPQAVIDHRWIKQGAQIVEESLVHWKYLPVEEATWVSTKQLLELFSNVKLGDKVSHNGGGIDKPRRSARVIKPNPKYVC